MTEQLICKACNKPYIYKGYKRSAASKVTCASCYVNKRRSRLKHKIVQYLGGECVRCGYNKSIHSLECHHLDPKLKAFAVSGAHCKSLRVIQAELDKCILLCSNCHREEEYGIVPPIRSDEMVSLATLIRP